MPSLPVRTRAAWLWSGRRAIIGGATAASLHGARWIPDDVPVELIHANTRPPDGVSTRRETLGVGETQLRDGLAVTTPERTAFDIGRRGAVRSSVVRLDALARATGFKVADVVQIAQAHPRTPGLRRLEAALDLVDPGAQSPRESYRRLLLIDAGLPRPQTQIPVLGADGLPAAYLDLGWPPSMVAVGTTATNTAATEGNTSKTFSGWKCRSDWAGSSSGSSPGTGPPESCAGCARRWRNRV